MINGLNCEKKVRKSIAKILKNNRDFVTKKKRKEGGWAKKRVWNFLGEKEVLAVGNFLTRGQNDFKNGSFYNKYRFFYFIHTSHC